MERTVIYLTLPSWWEWVNAKVMSEWAGERATEERRMKETSQHHPLRATWAPICSNHFLSILLATVVHLSEGEEERSWRQIWALFVLTLWVQEYDYQTQISRVSIPKPQLVPQWFPLDILWGNWTLSFLSTFLQLLSPQMTSTAKFKNGKEIQN